MPPEHPDLKKVAGRLLKLQWPFIGVHKRHQAHEQQEKRQGHNGAIDRIHDWYPSCSKSQSKNKYIVQIPPLVCINDAQ